MIQVFEPEIFSKIVENKQQLLKIFGSADEGVISHDKESFKKNKENLLNDIVNSEINSKKYFLKILKILFPQVNLENNSFMWQNKMEKELKICSYKHFDKYFELNINNNELSNMEFQTIFSKINNKKELKIEISNIIDKNGKTTSFLNRFMSIINDNDFDHNIDEIQNIISVFFDLGDLFEDINEGFSKPNKWLKINFLVDNLLKTVKDSNKRDNILKNAIIESKKSFLIGVFYIHRKIESNKNSNLNDNIISENCLKLLKSISLSKIKDNLENTGFEHKYFKNVIYFWNLWDQNGLFNYLSDLFSIDSIYINFITSFLQNTLISEISNDLEYEIILNKEVYDYLNFDDEKDRIKSIIRNNNDLSEDNKLALELFLKRNNTKNV